jgi:hypothetical protein
MPDADIMSYHSTSLVPLTLGLGRLITGEPVRGDVKIREVQTELVISDKQLHWSQNGCDRERPHPDREGWTYGADSEVQKNERHV